jgi:hypothetical protein
MTRLMIETGAFGTLRKTVDRLIFSVADFAFSFCGCGGEEWACRVPGVAAAGGRDTWAAFTESVWFAEVGEGDCQDGAFRDSCDGE